MGKKRKHKMATDANAKATEKRLEHYGEGHGLDKFGKKTNRYEVPDHASVVVKAVPLTKMGRQS